MPTGEPAVVRPVEHGDLAQLAELMHEHARYERASPLRPDLVTALAAALFQAHPRLHVLVAAAGNGLLGYASWALEASTWRVDEYAHLDCLYLRESARGRGTGRELLRAVAGQARSTGADELRWHTPDWNEGAIRFYRRLGAGWAAKIRFVLPLNDAPPE